MRKTWSTAAVILALVLSPFAVVWGYRRITAFPKEITIPQGPRGGRHEQIAESLSREIHQRFGVNTDRKVHTDGSVENLRLLQEGQVDFALYQTGTERVLRGLDSFFQTRDKNGDRQLNLKEFVAQPSPDEFQGQWSAERAEKAFHRLDADDDGSLSRQEYHDTSSIACVANLYSEVVHFFVRRGALIESPDDLRGKRVAVAVKTSGDYATSLILLDHFGLDEQSIDPKYLEHGQTEEAFLADELDAALITTGIHEPMFPRLFETGKCDLLSIPCAESLTIKHLSMSEHKIPKGHYRSWHPATPAGDIDTVALGAQLLTHIDVHAGLVEEVTRIVLSESFLKQHRLRELFDGGYEFARKKPEFAIHPGAQGVYDPGLHPLLPTDFVESMEGMRSFAVSVLIAVFFGARWLRRSRASKREHKLDRFIRSLLDMERRQVSLDAGGNPHDVQSLQKLLDEVTFLRQEALGKFSCHELNEDRGVDCFLEMCHALSDKINAKISRQRLDQRFDELARAIDGSGAQPLEKQTNQK